MWFWFALQYLECLAYNILIKSYLNYKNKPQIIFVRKILLKNLLNEKNLDLWRILLQKTTGYRFPIEASKNRVLHRFLSTSKFIISIIKYFKIYLNNLVPSWKSSISIFYSSTLNSSTSNTSFQNVVRQWYCIIILFLSNLCVH